MNSNHHQQESQTLEFNYKQLQQTDEILSNIENKINTLFSKKNKSNFSQSEEMVFQQQQQVGGGGTDTNQQKKSHELQISQPHIDEKNQDDYYFSGMNNFDFNEEMNNIDNANSGGKVAKSSQKQQQQAQEQQEQEDLNSDNNNNANNFDLNYLLLEEKPHIPQKKKSKAVNSRAQKQESYQQDGSFNYQQQQQQQSQQRNQQMMMTQLQSVASPTASLDYTKSIQNNQGLFLPQSNSNQVYSNASHLQWQHSQQKSNLMESSTLTPNNNNSKLSLKDKNELEKEVQALQSRLKSMEVNSLEKEIELQRSQKKIELLNSQILEINKSAVLYQNLLSPSPRSSPRIDDNHTQYYNQQQQQQGIVGTSSNNNGGVYNTAPWQSQQNQSSKNAGGGNNATNYMEFLMMKPSGSPQSTKQRNSLFGLSQSPSVQQLLLQGQGGSNQGKSASSKQFPLQQQQLQEDSIIGRMERMEKFYESKANILKERIAILEEENSRLGAQNQKLQMENQKAKEELAQKRDDTNLESDRAVRAQEKRMQRELENVLSTVNERNRLILLEKNKINDQLQYQNDQLVKDKQRLQLELNELRLVASANNSNNNNLQQQQQQQLCLNCSVHNHKQQSLVQRSNVKGKNGFQLNVSSTSSQMHNNNNNGSLRAEELQVVVPGENPQQLWLYPHQNQPQMQISTASTKQQQLKKAGPQQQQYFSAAAQQQQQNQGASNNSNNNNGNSATTTTTTMDLVKVYQEELNQLRNKNGQMNDEFRNEIRQLKEALEIQKLENRNLSKKILKIKDKKRLESDNKYPSSLIAGQVKYQQQSQTMIGTQSSASTNGHNNISDNAAFLVATLKDKKKNALGQEELRLYAQALEKQYSQLEERHVSQIKKNHVLQNNLKKIISKQYNNNNSKSKSNGNTNNKNKNKIKREPASEEDDDSQSADNKPHLFLKQASPSSPSPQRSALVEEGGSARHLRKAVQQQAKNNQKLGRKGGRGQDIELLAEEGDSGSAFQQEGGGCFEALENDDNDDDDNNDNNGGRDSRQRGRAKHLEAADREEQDFDEEDNCSGAGDLLMEDEDDADADLDDDDNGEELFSSSGKILMKSKKGVYHGQKHLQSQQQQQKSSFYNGDGAAKTRKNAKPPMKRQNRAGKQGPSQSSQIIAGASLNNTSSNANNGAANFSNSNNNLVGDNNNNNYNYLSKTGHSQQQLQYLHQKKNSQSSAASQGLGQSQKSRSSSQNPHNNNSNHAAATLDSRKNGGGGGGNNISRSKSANRVKITN